MDEKLLCKVTGSPVRIYQYSPGRPRLSMSFCISPESQEREAGASLLPYCLPHAFTSTWATLVGGHLALTYGCLSPACQFLSTAQGAHAVTSYSEAWFLSPTALWSFLLPPLLGLS